MAAGLVESFSVEDAAAPSPQDAASSEDSELKLRYPWLPEKELHKDILFARLFMTINVSLSLFAMCFVQYVRWSPYILQRLQITREDFRSRIEAWSTTGGSLDTFISLGLVEGPLEDLVLPQTTAAAASLGNGVSQALSAIALRWHAQDFAGGAQQAPSAPAVGRRLIASSSEVQAWIGSTSLEVAVFLLPSLLVYLLIVKLPRRILPLALLLLPVFRLLLAGLNSSLFEDRQQLLQFFSVNIVVVALLCGGLRCLRSHAAVAKLLLSTIAEVLLSMRTVLFCFAALLGAFASICSYVLFKSACGGIVTICRLEAAEGSSFGFLAPLVYLLRFPLFFSAVWLPEAIGLILFVGYSRLFACWYCGLPLRTSPKEFVVALRGSIGSAGLAGFLISSVRLCELLRGVHVPVASCFLECLSRWILVQCAVRNVSVGTSSRITWALSRAVFLKSAVYDSFIGVATASALVSIFMVTLACNLPIEFVIAIDELEIVVQLLNVVSNGIGMRRVTSAWFVTDIVSAGSKTIIMLWAEDRKPLAKAHPEVHDAIERGLEAATWPRKAAHLGPEASPGVEANGDGEDTQPDPAIGESPVMPGLPVEKAV